MKIVLDSGAVAPTRAHDTDAGLDLYSMEDVTLIAGRSAIIHTGVHIQLPHGYGGLLVSKSGLNVLHDITSTGLIDEGYTGEIVVKLYNHGSENYNIKKGDKITQLVLIPVAYEDVEIVDSLDSSERGSNGFGSSGK